MECESSHPFWGSTLSCRVTPKPLVNLQGENASMPRTCLPGINARRFTMPFAHDHENSVKANCIWNARRLKSTPRRGREPELQPRRPTPVKIPRSSSRALEKGLKNVGELSTRLPHFLPFLDSDVVAQGLRKMKKVVTRSQSPGRESEPHIHRAQPSTLLPPRESISTSDLALDTIAAKDVQEVKRIGRLPTCLKVDTDLEAGTPDTDEDSFGFPLQLPHIAPIKTEDVVRGRKTLVLNLHGTLIYSSLNELEHFHFKIPAWVSRRLCEVFVVKRPGVEEFLKEVARKYEVVVLTASPRQYTDLVVDMLDQGKFIPYRLYEDSCIPTANGWVKDLSVLGRELTKVITVDNKPNAYRLQPENSLIVRPFTGDKNDKELYKLLAELELVWRMNV